MPPYSVYEVRMKYLFDIFKGFSSRIPEPENRRHSNEPPKAPPPVKRIFEFERRPDYLWGAKSDYEDLGYDESIGNNVRLAQWGRKYTDHAIEKTLPSGERYRHSGPNDSGEHTPSQSRSIMPSVVERTITYGERQVLRDGRVNYVLGDIRVGVSGDESIVHTVHKEPKKREP